MYNSKWQKLIDSLLQIKYNTRPDINSVIYFMVCENWIESDKNEDIYILWGKLMLDQLMKEAVIGDYLVIRYKGKIKTPDEHMMNEYDVEIINLDEEDWLTLLLLEVLWH